MKCIISSVYELPPKAFDELKANQVWSIHFLPFLYFLVPVAIAVAAAAVLVTVDVVVTGGCARCCCYCCW